MAGKSLRQSLLSAGYAPSTSRAPKSNGLSAERCLAELAKLDPSADPRTLAVEARRVALRTIRALGSLSESKLLEGRHSSTVAKLWDTAERFHGSGGEAPGVGVARAFAERAAEMRIVLDELDRRGLLGATTPGVEATTPGPVVDVKAKRSHGPGE